MSAFTIGWQAPANIGLLPQHPDDGQQPFFSIGWIVKQQATWYPYDATDLLVAPGAGPDAPAGGGGGETPTPTPSGGGGGGGGTVTGAGDTTPSPQIRARVATANLAARKDPGLFRRKGLTFALSLEAPATVTAVLVTTSGKKLTYSQTRKVTAGTDHLTLRPSDYGKLATRTSKKVAAKLVVTIKYTDKSTGTLTKSISLAAPPKKK